MQRSISIFIYMDYMKKTQYFLLFFIFNFIFIKSCHFILISAPGSGKGTFSQYMTEKYGYLQICPGDIFRKEILLQTELGKAIQPIVEAGDYVDEKIVCSLILNYIQKALDQNKLFILDGFPRSENSLNFLLNFLTEKNLLSNVCFLQFNLPDELCKQRVLTRFVCNDCGKVDNATMIDSLEVPKCKRCHNLLNKRPGDTEQVISKRLLYFHEIIEPLFNEIAHSGHTTKIINTNQNICDLEKIYENLFF